MLEKEYTLKDFTGKNERITASGYFSTYSGKYEVNYSSVLTKLIQVAGRFTEHFASDLFITWESVVNTLDDITENSNETFLFGFRQNGVDSNYFVLSRYNGQACYGNPRAEYRAMYRLDIETVADMVEMNLVRVF